MSIAKILVPVSGAPTDAVALSAAMVAAAPFSAHVQALFIPADPRASIPYGAPISPTVIDSIMSTLEELNKKASLRAHEMLADAAKREGATVCDKPQILDRVSCSYKEDMGFFAARTARHARLSDLVVFPALPNDVFSEVNAAMVETLMQVERPILIAPQMPDSLTKKISIAWDGSVACTHALTASLPFLQHARKIELLEIEPQTGNGLSIEEAKDYLQLHRIAAATRAVKRDKHTTAEVILHEAASGGASLLVMGAYGHNRFAEAVFGGVSSHIKWHATMPVLMAH